jgi:hypothetical protein
VPIGKRLGSFKLYAMTSSWDIGILTAQCVGQLIGFTAWPVFHTIPK